MGLFFRILLSYRALDVYQPTEAQRSSLVSTSPIQFQFRCVVFQDVGDEAPKPMQFLGTLR